MTRIRGRRRTGRLRDECAQWSSMRGWPPRVWRAPNPSRSTASRSRLRDALTSSYDVCRVTPNLMAFVAERCADQTPARMLKAPKRHSRRVAGRAQRGGRRRGVRGARGPGRMAGGAGASGATVVFDLVQPAGEPTRGAGDGVGRALSQCARRAAGRGVVDVPGRSGVACRGVPAAVAALPAARATGRRR